MCVVCRPCQKELPRGQPCFKAKLLYNEKEKALLPLPHALLSLSLSLSPVLSWYFFLKGQARSEQEHREAGGGTEPVEGQVRRAQQEQTGGPQTGEN